MDSSMRTITNCILNSLRTGLPKFFGAIFRKNRPKMRRRWRRGVPRTNRDAVGKVDEILAESRLNIRRVLNGARLAKQSNSCRSTCGANLKP